MSHAVYSEREGVKRPGNVKMQTNSRQSMRKASGPRRKDETFWRALTFGAVLVGIALVAQGIFGSNGLMTYLQKRRQYSALHQQIQQMKLDNQTLQKEVQGLKSNAFTIERYAREDLHMARQHELIYLLPQKPADSRNVNSHPQAANTKSNAK